MRVQVMKPAPHPTGAVAYWMSRDQRCEDNWALLYAQERALERGEPLLVLFCLAPRFPGANLRSYSFMWQGLQEVGQRLRDHSIPMHVLWGAPETALPAFIREHDVGLLVADFSPLRVARQWKERVAAGLPEAVGLHVVDAHNVVPCWVASPKQEVGARTIRSKLWMHAEQFLTPFPALRKQPVKPEHFPDIPTLEVALAKVEALDTSVKPIDWAAPGTAAGMAQLRRFLDTKLKLYGSRNDPNVDALSNLSPYLHFGQISAQRVVLEAQRYKRDHAEAIKSFVEELFVRRELSDNFCFHQPQYDSLDGAAGWAKETLQVHTKDPREFLYSRDEFEKYQTHDDLWNAAQKQMVEKGKMHGFLRMYWCKKILEWTPS
eukprot:EG_transcript_11783